MTYAEADRQLQGRCKKSRRIARNTYLERDAVGTAIYVRLHSTRIITLRADGTVRLCMGGWNTITTKDRLNRFLPRPWQVWSHASMYGGYVALGQGWQRGAQTVFDSHDVITITPEGEIEGGTDPAEAMKEHRAEVNAQRRERYKERFWILKARRGGKLRKPLTLGMIQSEQNVTVRMAMAKVYGIERFLTDVEAAVIDTHGEYQLISYSLSRMQSITALKMVCPSTQVTYIHPVQPGCATVSDALDWMFQTPKYLERIAAEA
jgi:hypothetical protein